MKYDPDTIGTIVIKLGTNLISGAQAFEGQVIEDVVKEICTLKNTHSLNVVLVSSGAIGCGMRALNLPDRPASLPDKQAVAAVGQSYLMHYYQTLFATYGGDLHTAQVLLTTHDLDDRQHYLNARNTLHTLFAMKRVVPIVNENDSTATDELRFSDNDNLAARVAAKIDADLLVILTDVDGLYDRNPADDDGARLIEQVSLITDALIASAGQARTPLGTGGMRAKLEAARIATRAGVPVVIANGHRASIIQKTLDGSAPGTTFAPAANQLSQRKRWIAFGRRIEGALHVDAGAARALAEQGRSLLPAGVVSVTGHFSMGATVTVHEPGGQVIARALTNYSSADIERILGKQSSEIGAVLGRKDFDEVVHRDNLALV